MVIHGDATKSVRHVGGEPGEHDRRLEGLVWKAALRSRRKKMVKEAELEAGRRLFVTFRRTASTLTSETRFESCCKHSFHYF